MLLFDGDLEGEQKVPVLSCALRGVAPTRLWSHFEVLLLLPVNNFLFDGPGSDRIRKALRLGRTGRAQAPHTLSIMCTDGTKDMLNELRMCDKEGAPTVTLEYRPYMN